MKLVNQEKDGFPGLESNEAKKVTDMPGFLDATVSTYREGVPEGVAAGTFCRHLGFAEGKLAGPVQEFVTYPKDSAGGNR